MILSRRSFLTGLIAAPVIVRAGIIMPVKPLDLREFDTNFWYLDGVKLPPDVEVAVFHTRFSARELINAGLMNWRGSFGG